LAPEKKQCLHWPPAENNSKKEEKTEMHTAQNYKLTKTKQVY